MLRAVLFDLDGTLVDQESAAAAAVVPWAAEHGICDGGVARRWTAISETHYRCYQRRELTFVGQRRARVREFLGVDMVDEDADAAFAGYLVGYESGWALFPDALPALRRARDLGLKVVVLTNGDEHHQQLKVSRLGLDLEIDHLVASSSLPAGKPDPRAFVAALSRVDASPGETLMVGDSLEADVLGAQGAGLHAVLIDRQAICKDPDVPRITRLTDLSFTEMHSPLRAPDV